MGTIASVLAAIETKLDGVTGIGVTHAYTRFNADWATYLGHFKTTISGTVQIRGWVVTLDNSNPVVGAQLAFSSIKRTVNVLIYGILGLDDSAATETTFENLVESVMDALDAEMDYAVDGVIDYGIAPCVLRTFDVRQFGSVMCHYCEIVQAVEIEKDLART